MAPNEAALICGDIAWAVSGDPRTSVMGRMVIGAAAKSAAKKAKATGKSPSMVKAIAAAAAKAAAAKLAKQRAELAKKRLAVRPPAVKKAAVKTAKVIKALPKPVAKKVITSVAKKATIAHAKVVAKKATPKKPVVKTVKPSTRTSYAPTVSTAPLATLDNGTEVFDTPSYAVNSYAPSTNTSGPTSYVTETLQDVADAAWTESDEPEEEPEETEEEELDEPEEEPEETEEEELDEPEEEPEEEEELDMFENELAGDPVELASLLGLDELEIVGWNPLSGIKKAVNGAVKGVNKIATTVSKSKLIKAGVAGAAFVCPAVGVPAAAALAVAGKVATATKSKDPKKKAAAIKLVTATHAAAKAGDKDAEKGLAFITVANRALKTQQAKTVVAALPEWKKRVIVAIQKAS